MRYVLKDIWYEMPAFAEVRNIPDGAIVYAYSATDESRFLYLNVSNGMTEFLVPWEETNVRVRSNADTLEISGVVAGSYIVCPTLYY